MATESEVEHIQLHDHKTVFYLVAVDENGDAVDLTNADILDVYFTRPISKENFRRDGTIHDAISGTFKYPLEVMDINEVGLFTIQGYIRTPNWQGSTAKGTFYAEGNIYNNCFQGVSAFTEGA